MLETDLTLAPPALPAREEYVERQERARRTIADAGLDGLLAFGSRAWPWAVRWLADHQSGFQQLGNSMSFGDRGFSALVLPVDGPPILLLDQRSLPGECAVDDARTVERITLGAAAALADAGLTGKRIGIAGEGVMLDRHRREIEAATGTALDLHPADHLIEPLHRVKSPAELECMRYASAVGAAWMKAMMEAAAPGRTEADLVSIGLPVLLRHGGFPADVVAGSGNPCRPQAARGIPSYNSERPLEAGDLLRLDGFGPVRGYGCDLARSTCVGAAPTAAQREVLEHAVEFIDTLIAAVRPGVTHEAVHDLGTAWLGERGYPPHAYFEGFWPAFGHQIGLTTEGPFIAAGETDPIQAGQVMSIEIVLGTPETGGISHEESFIVTADGTELLTAGCPQRWW
ncbi:MAG: aminopeptidase P family protein [Actinobacteria bacterium]|nr:aminopeptidase P family protein [Actinomycetota bacterium]